MTTQIALSAAESLPIGSNSNDAPISRDQGVIYLKAIAVHRPISLPNTVSLNSFIRELEADDAMANHLTVARRNLAATLYADEPETLSAIRLTAGLSQAKLAARMETSQSYIGRLECGRLDPATEMVARIADALNIDEERAFRAIRNQLATRGQDV